MTFESRVHGTVVHCNFSVDQKPTQLKKAHSLIYENPNSADPRTITQRFKCLRNIYFGYTHTS